MSQNRSHAVMAQRIEPHDSLDHFPTPPWATRALFEHVIQNRVKRTCWEPACGTGEMSLVIQEYWPSTFASDVHDYGWGHAQHDFLQPYLPEGMRETMTEIEWIITNPPFRLAQEFVERSLSIVTIGVAILVRSVFIESIERYNELFKRRPPGIMAQFVERVPMVKGRLDRKASTATSYCWLVWPSKSVPREFIDTRLQWIPPCRAHLERSTDYGDTP